MTTPDERPATSQSEPGGTPRPDSKESHVDLHSSQNPASRPSRFIWPLILLAGLTAGLESFGVGEVAPSLVPPALDLPPEIRADRNQVPAETERRMRRSKDLSAAITYGGLGMLLGLGLGVAGGLARGSGRAAIAAGLTGLVLGGASGAGVTRLVLPFYHAARAASTDETANLDVALALGTHASIWLAVGAAAGIALGVGLGGAAQVVRAVIGGILGAVLAAVIYEFAGAVAFPLAETFRPIAATWPPRLMAHLVVALCATVGALWAARNLRLGRATPNPQLVTIASA